MIPESSSSLIRQELEHPYLFFSAEDLPALREQCKGGRSSAIYRKIKAKVDRAHDDGFPTSPPREQCYRHGRWEDYSRATGLAKKLVLDCAFVAIIEDNDSYSETAWEWVTAYMRWPSWVHTAHEFGLIDLTYMESRKNVPASSPYLRFLLQGEPGRTLATAAFVCGAAEDDLTPRLEGIRVGESRGFVEISSPAGTTALPLTERECPDTGI